MEEKFKKYGLLTIFYKEDEKGNKVVTKLRFGWSKVNEYQFEGGVPVEFDVVGSDQIKDDSIQMEDLNKGIFATDEDIKDILKEITQ